MERFQGNVDQQASPQAKIALFRTLFRGRDDVYPRRFESTRTDRSGYAPACANEWVRGVCEKPQVKCAECPHRRFLPVTDDVIRWHLSGHDDGGQPFVAGVYPMLQDETCLFLAVDFDKQGWHDDTTAFLETCRLLDVPAALERSRSGRGGHVWLFFEEALPAALARKLGSHALTEPMERRPDIGLDSYDRFFPNEDTLPQGGFGNLIALPLQKRAREQGNSVFLDDRFEPYPDQWSFLATIRKISRSRVEDLVRDAERRGRVVGVRLPALDEDDVEPWAVPPSRRTKEPPIPGHLPSTMELVLGDEVYVERDGLAPGLRNRLLRLAAFQNPQFYKAQAMRLPTYDKPRIISCAEEHPHHIGLPRGCLKEVSVLPRVAASCRESWRRKGKRQSACRRVGVLSCASDRHERDIWSSGADRSRGTCRLRAAGRRGCPGEPPSPAAPGQTPGTALPRFCARTRWWTKSVTLVVPRRGNYAPVFPRTHRR